MRKILSMVLVLTMILSFMTVVATGAEQTAIQRMALVGDMEAQESLASFGTRLGSKAIVEGAGIDGSKAMVITRNETTGSALKNEQLAYSSKANIKAGYTYYASAMIKSSSQTYSAFTMEGGYINVKPRYADGTQGSGLAAATSDNWRGLHTTPSFGDASGWNPADWNRISGRFDVTHIREGDINGKDLTETGDVIELELRFGASQSNGGSMNGTTDYTSFPQTTTVDDFYFLEVPTNALTADAIPVVYGVDFTGEFKQGGVLTATSVSYDVNPNVTPSVAYTWQRKVDGNWTDAGAGDTYTVSFADSGKEIRVKATASSVTTENGTKTDIAYSASKTMPDFESALSKFAEIGDMEAQESLASFGTRLGSKAIVEGAGIDGSKAMVITRNETTGSALKNEQLAYSSKANIKAGYTYYASAMIKSSSQTYSAFTMEGGYINVKPRYADGTQGSGLAAATGDNWRGLHTTPSFGDASGWNPADWNRISGRFDVTHIKESDKSTEFLTETGDIIELELRFGASQSNGGSMNGTTDYTSFPQTTTVDDFYFLEVPANNLTADAIPVVYGVKVTGDYKAGSTLTVTSESYDVNPNVTPSVAYTWQKKVDGDWTDVGTETTYTPQDTDGILRVKATASSNTSANGVKTDVSYSSEMEPAPLAVSFNISGATSKYSVNGSEAVNTADTEIPYGASLKLTFTPVEGKVVNKVTYNGAEYPVIKNEVTITITVDGSVSATAEDIPVALPKVSSSELGTPVNSYTFKDVTGKSAVIFVRNALGYGYTVSETGCLLICGDEQVTLKNRSSDNEYFGIRVISSMFDYDTDYTLRPFIKVEGAENVYGEDKTFSFKEDK